MRRRFNRLFENLEKRDLLAADPVISEFMASNQSTLVDADGKSPDWIEIHNAGDEALNLRGWFLTDSPNDLTKWQIPDVPASELNAGGYLVVRASDEDRVDEDGQLHTNFKLSASGDYVALVSPGQNVVSEFGQDFAEYPEQFEDVSYGRAENGEVGYFREPTPGGTNSNAVDGFVADTEFSLDRGFYDQPFSVEITSATPGATIVYTTDGSEPTMRNGTQVTIGPGEVPVALVSIETTTTLRAAAFKAGFDPTNVDTQSYFFINDVLEQPRRPDGFPTSWSGAPAADYEMDPQIVDDPAYTEDIAAGLREIPTVSLVSDVDGIFGRNGIYTNPQNGDLEVPTSVEWISPAGETEFQIDAGLKVSGGASRTHNNSPKHSMSLRFRSEYGAGRLNHQLFEGSEVDSFNSLQLRALYNNSWIHWNSGQQHRGTLIRDQFVRDSLIAMGQDDAGHGTYAHVYINGLYWGVYNVQERPDSAHFAEYHGGAPDEYDAFNGTTLVDGTRSSYNRMRSTVRTTDNWAAVEEVLDVDNYIDWTLAQAYGGNEDIKLEGNWRAAGGGSADGKWRIYAWDSERILEGPTARPPTQLVDPLEIRDELLRFPEFVLRFGDRVEKHFKNDGALTPDSVRARWDARVEELTNAIVAESARWGDYRRDVHRRGDDIELYTRDDHWLPEHERLRTENFPFRTDFVYDNLRAAGWVPTPRTPEFIVNGGQQHGGVLPSNESIGFTIGEQQQTVTESVELIGSDSAVSAFVPTDASLETGNGPLWYAADFDDANWTRGTNGVGYENSTSGAYRNRLGTDLNADWNATRSSIYSRFEFNLDVDAADFDRLQLNMIFDDGFVAFLNGQAIDVDQNGNDNLAPSTVRWNSRSSGDDRPDAEVLSGPVSFDLTAFQELLLPGANVLAIQGLNQSTSSSDMLIEAELVLQKTEFTLPSIYYTVDGTDPRADDSSPAGMLFVDAFSLNASATVRARSLVGNEWSALLEADFIVDRILADINGDGSVNFADFLILSQNFGMEQDDDPIEGDLDLDGVVGFADFLILSQAFGT